MELEELRYNRQISLILSSLFNQIDLILINILNDLARIEEWEYEAEGLSSSHPDYIKKRDEIKQYLALRKEYYMQALKVDKFSINPLGFNEVKHKSSENVYPDRQS